MFDMCFEKTTVKTQKLVNAQIKSGSNENGNLFYFRLLETPLFCRSEDKNISFLDKKLSFLN